MVDMEQRRVAIREFLKLRRDLKIAGWEKKAGLGDGTLRKFLDGRSQTLTDKTYQQLAAAAGVAVTVLQSPPSPSEATNSTSGNSQVLASVPVRNGTVDLPVWGVRPLSAGIWEINPRPIAMTIRPDILKYSHNAFGIYCNGTEQSPAFEPRDMLLVDPTKPAAIGDDVLFAKGFHGADTEPFRSILRRLIGETATHYLVEQFNPRERQKLAKDEWPHLLYVAGKFSR